MIAGNSVRRAVALAIAVAAVATGALAHAEARAEKQAQVRSSRAMGTRVTVTMWGVDGKLVEAGSAAVFAEFARVDRLMTSWLDSSDVSKINSAAGRRAIPVGEEVFAVIARALDVSRRSQGAFDITVGAFRGLWKFDQDIDGTIPTPAAVKQRLALVGYRGVILDRRKKTVKLRRQGMRITLGGIAKGYAVDRAVAILRGLGINDFILQAGGDLFVAGRRGKRAWRVGIRDPRGARDAIFAIAEIEDRTFSTSGDYERAVLKDGVRYHHILDPATGNPVTRSRSVTVMAPDALTADVWSTALFVMGVERGMKLVNKMANVEAVFVDAGNKVHISPGLDGKVWINKPPTPGP